MNYKKLLNKKINLEFNGLLINSYKITEIKLSEHLSKDRGFMYECKVDWFDKTLDGSYPVMEFDEHTLNELLNKKISGCPIMPRVSFRVTS